MPAVQWGHDLPYPREQVVTNLTTTEALALITDRSRVLRTRDYPNAWGQALYVTPGSESFSSVGWMFEPGDVLIGYSGNTMAVVTEFKKWDDPPDAGGGMFVDVGDDLEARFVFHERVPDMKLVRRWGRGS